jgi:hypothetical protein
LGKNAATDSDATAGAEERLVFITAVERGTSLIAKGDAAEIRPIRRGAPGGRAIESVFAGDIVVEFGCGERSPSIACLGGETRGNPSRLSSSTRTDRLALTACGKRVGVRTD